MFGVERIESGFFLIIGGAQVIRKIAGVILIILLIYLIVKDLKAVG
ncbi:MAG: hypothetical protein KBT36_12725 [Kurthia sp.]|nr:hypothetical protein [Candidatus Kurthia equi]